MKNLVLIACSLLLLSSCTLEQAFRFNSDYSGRYEMKLDMSAMAGMMGESEGYTSPLDTMNIDSMVTALNSVPGISNAVIADDEGVMKIAYDFNDLETLNLALGDQELGEMFGGGSGMKSGNKPMVSRKGKKFSYKAPDLSELGDSEESMDEMEGMGDMFRYKVIMSFPKEIKKVNNKDATVSIDKKSVTFESSFTELTSGKSDPSMEIRLK